MAMFTLLGAISILFLIKSNTATECGKKEAPVQNLIVNGWPASSWPWHGAVFHSFGEHWEYRCGATILTEEFLLTAQHCTYDKDDKLVDEDRMIVKLGLVKLDTPDEFIQVHRVARIINHENFAYGKNDIALVKVFRRIYFVQGRVQPICLWNGDYKLDKVIGTAGYIAGWGYDETHTITNNLQESTMKIVSNFACNISDPTFYRLLPKDKKTFCAGYRNGSYADQGDSGGGLYLKKGDTWLIRGIISITKQKVFYADPNSYTVFADVAQYQDWIEQYVPDIRSYYPENSANTCGFRTLFTIEKNNVPIGWPWHGALFHKSSKNDNLSYQCGVTILTAFFVLTAAHCTVDQRYYKNLVADRMFVKVGLYKLNKTNHEQIHEVLNVIRHEYYNKFKREDDIALLNLKQKINFDGIHVHPICLWDGDIWLKTVVGQTGYITGWGRNENGDISNELQEAEMPLVSRKTCVDSDPAYYGTYYHDPKTFCAGSRNGTNAGFGDSGGGLYLQIGEQWFLRGIINNIKFHNETTADFNNYLLLADVAFYQFWIREHIPFDQFPPQ